MKNIQMVIPRICGNTEDCWELAVSSETVEDLDSLTDDERQTVDLLTWAFIAEGPRLLNVTRVTRNCLGFETGNLVVDAPNDRQMFRIC